jgi:methionine aminotransferase
MEAIGGLLRGTDILLLSDEVYEHLVYDGEPHASTIHWPELRERAFVVFSFGKVFHATGWKMGYVLAPEALMAEFRKVHQFNVFSVHTPAQYALARYLREPEHYEATPGLLPSQARPVRHRIEGLPLQAVALSGVLFPDRGLQ